MAISRREFLRCCAGGAMAWGMFPWFDLAPARADSGNGTRLLILNMNGGWDGLTVLQPADGALYSSLSSLRPSLIQSPSGLHLLGNGYGFAPQLSIFKTLFDEGTLAGVCNVGCRNMSRSHDESESVFAQGIPDRIHPASTGFINRLGAEYRWNSLQAVSVSGAERTFSGGDYRGIQIGGLGRYRFAGDRGVKREENEQRRDALYALSQAWTGAAQSAAQADVISSIELVNDTSDTLSDALGAASFAAAYPESELGQKLRDIDVLFSTPGLGTEVGYVRRGGFDSHSAQLSTLPSLLQELNDALAVFVANMKAKGLWSNLIVLVISEFGRTNRENGSIGTDHGGAVPVFLLGGAVRGGSLIGEVLPGDLTDNAWLPMRYNIVDIYRQVFAEMNYDPNRVFEATGDAALPALFT